MPWRARACPRSVGISGQITRTRVVAACQSDTSTRSLDRPPLKRTVRPRRFPSRGRSDGYISGFRQVLRPICSYRCSSGPRPSGSDAARRTASANIAGHEASTARSERCGAGSAPRDERLTRAFARRRMRWGAVPRRSSWLDCFAAKRTVCRKCLCRSAGCAGDRPPSNCGRRCYRRCYITIFKWPQTISVAR